MPTYDYECQKGHRFEIFQKMSDDPVTECPDCGAAAQRKISGGAGFLFKGDGFYITETRSDDYKKKASADKGESPSEAAPKESSTKTESSGSSEKGGSSGSSDS
jgi:putative FmdB family regulatory protein